MTRSAPRLTQRLLDAIERLDDRREPLAEIARRVCAEADRLGLTRPSYERVRQLIHASRAVRTRRGRGPARIVLEDAAINRLGPATVYKVERSLEDRRT